MPARLRQRMAAKVPPIVFDVSFTLSAAATMTAYCIHFFVDWQWLRFLWVATLATAVVSACLAPQKGRSADEPHRRSGR